MASDAANGLTPFVPQLTTGEDPADFSYLPGGTNAPQAASKSDSITAGHDGKHPSSQPTTYDGIGKSTMSGAGAPAHDAKSGTSKDDKKAADTAAAATTPAATVAVQPSTAAGAAALGLPTTSSSAGSTQIGAAATAALGESTAPSAAAATGTAASPTSNLVSQALGGAPDPYATLLQSNGNSGLGSATSVMTKM